MTRQTYHFLRGKSREAYKRRWIESGKKNAILMGIIGVALIVLGVVLFDYLIGILFLIIGVTLIFSGIYKKIKWGRREDKYYKES